MLFCVMCRSNLDQVVCYAGITAISVRMVLDHGNEPVCNTINQLG
jgi:hypothetical protein